jgi:hypothetical protein
LFQQVGDFRQEVVAITEALKKIDTDGSPIKMGDTKFGWGKKLPISSGREKVFFNF